MNSSSPNNSSSRSALAAALEELRHRRAEIVALRNERNEPIAVVGMACRFPGDCDTPEDFWRLLDQGRDGITEVPSERWDANAFYDSDPAVPGKMATRYGGFLRAVDDFDTHFFGISPRESTTLDPQQRLLLEVVWEALENANLPPEQLRGSPTGVFVGITCFDHAIRLGRSPVNFGAYAGTGSALNMAAGRISYFLGLTGPSMAIDTACSSSLVSIHLACESLRAKETDLALAGGVNLMLSPDVMVSFSQARMLSADGRSKTFDAAADGYVRGEGCGVVVLKRLSNAQADGDTILGVLRGSAVNQNGPTGGLTVPSGAAQQRVIERALSEAGVAASDVHYVEAHGTGTSLGDPIEIEAIARAYGKDRAPENPILTGSVKTNIGHLEPASGVAGLIKVLLSFRYGKIPAHLNFTSPNPHIAWNEIPVRVASTATPWPTSGSKRIAGLSAFGFSGTNAHAIIEEPPARPTPVQESVRRCQLLTISAKSEEALKGLAERYRELLVRRPDIDLAAVCHGAGAGRSHFPFRLAAPAHSTTELRERLASFGSNGAAPLLQVKKARTAGQRKIGFLFTGQGSQSVGMARQLYETEKSFKAHMDQMAELLVGHIDLPLLDVMLGRNGCERLLDQTAYAQPALFAVEYALAELWKSWGVKPFAVMGHSAGEYVAACQAGVIRLEDALSLVAARARLMQQQRPSGTMFTVFASGQIVRDAIKALGAEVAIAAINGPLHTVTSGPREVVEAVGKQLAERGIRVKELKVSHAFHSPLMKPMLDEFRSLVEQVHFSKPTTRIVSNLTGALVDDEMTDPEYWVRHVMEPVNFAAGMTALDALNLDAFLEVGPEPVLTAMGRECLGGEPGRWLFSLRSQQENWDTMLAALAACYVHGVTIDWPAFYRDQPPRVSELPNYPFQRQRYSIEPPQTAVQSVTPATHESREDLVRRLTQSGKLSEESLRAVPEVLQAIADLGQPGNNLDDLLYQVVWEEQGRLRQTLDFGVDGGSWLIFADRGGVGQGIAELLAREGLRSVLAYTGPEYRRFSDTNWQLRSEAPEDFNRLLREVSFEENVGRIIFLWGLDAPAADGLTSAQLEVCQKDGCGAVLNLIHACAGSRSRVWLVTRGGVSVSVSVSVSGYSRADGLAQSPLWGFGRGILLEQQERLGGSIDLDPLKPIDEMKTLVAEIMDHGPEDQVAFRDGLRLVPRLKKFASSTTPGAGVKISPEGAYLITGGFGALGLRVARWLVNGGARQLVLVSRKGPSTAEALAAIANLQAAGANIVVEQADIADEESIGGLFARLKLDHIRLRGIVHAAGIPGFRELEELTNSELEAVLRPKVLGTWLLHRFSQGEELDFLVLFSSIASVWGSRGQAHYSAANRFLDVLANHRRAIGLPAVCINWGPWGEGGMTTAEADTLLRRIGVRPLSPSVAIDALDHVLASGIGDVAVTDMDWGLFRGSYEARGKRPFLEHISQGTPLEVETAKPSDFLEQLRACMPHEQKRLLQRFIQAEAAQVLGLGLQLLDPEQGFFELGMDSLLALEFKARLETALLIRLPPTLIFDNPTIERLAEFLIQEIFARPGNDPAETRSQSEERDFAQSLAKRIEQLSDAEAEELLLQKLEAMI